MTSRSAILAPGGTNSVDVPVRAAPVVVGKSLGSVAAPLAADRGPAAVWFTPLLTAVEDFLDQAVWP